MDPVKVLIVCYGNICRSPMGEVMLQKEAEERGVGERIQVGSAGYLDNGRPAHPFSIQTMRRRGLDCSQHSSRLLTPMLISQTDVILAMEEGLAERARNLGAERAYNLAPYATLGEDTGPVDDPIGKPLQVFEDCALRLELLVPKALDRILQEKKL